MSESNNDNQISNQQKGIYQRICYIIKNNFILFLIGIIIKMFILLALIINFYVSRNDYVWFNSKILTINEIFQENYENYKIYQNFSDREFYNALNFSYYDLLKNSTKDKCQKDLKQCGILDTYGNKLCLYKDYPCPVNEIIVDFLNKSGIYRKEGYNIVKYHMLSYNSNYIFYYKNTSIDKKIISTLFWSPNKTQPRFIDSHNFIFDFEAFEKKFENKLINNTYKNISDSTNTNETNPNNTNNTNTTLIIKENNNENKNVQLEFNKTIEGEEDDDITIWYNTSKIKVKLIQNNGLLEYIKKQLNKTYNNDTNYDKIYDDIYIRNFYGFENAEQMDIFKNTNFTIYKNIFPHNIRLGIIIFYEVCFFVFIIIYIRKILEDKDKGEKSACKENENFIIIIGMSIYSISLLYFLSFFIKSLIDLNDNNKFDNLKKINCDKYFKDFIKEFIEKYNKKKPFIICLIIVFIISFFLYCFHIFFIFLSSLKKNNSNESNPNQSNLNEEQNEGDGGSDKKEEDNKIIPFESRNNGNKENQEIQKSNSKLNCLNFSKNKKINI